LIVATFETVRGAAALALAEEMATNCFQNGRWVAAIALVRQRPHQFLAIRARHAGGSACLFGALHRRWGVPVFESMPMGGCGGWVSERPLDAREQQELMQAWLPTAWWPVVDMTSPLGAAEVLPAPGCAALAARLGGGIRPLETHTLALQADDQQLLKAVRSSVRSYLRRVDALGFSFQIGGSELLPAFLEWYRRGSSQWKEEASGLWPEGFFAELLARGHGDIWLVSVEGREVGAGFFVRGHDDVLYQASGTEKISAPVSAMDAMVWSAVRHYRDQGYALLNLGGSQGLDSVRRFKEKFGARPVSYCRTTYLFPRFSLRRRSSGGNDA